VIAVDTSSLRRFLSGETGTDVDSVAVLIERSQLVLPPIVLTEILSEPHLQRRTIDVLVAVPELEISVGYWARAGQLRAKVIERGFKAKIADALIAQSCLDHEVALVTYDRDFRHFVPWGLTLA
jgi:predicted nucleic acid-binding protein